MKADIKYALITLEITAGELTFKSQLAVHFKRAKTFEQMDAYADICAKEFYTGSSYAEHSGYMFFNGTVCVSVMNAQPLTEAEYDVLQQFL